MSITTPLVNVCCDLCQSYVDIELEALARGNWSMANVRPTLDKYGWREDEHGNDICDECVREKRAAS